MFLKRSYFRISFLLTLEKAAFFGGVGRVVHLKAYWHVLREGGGVTGSFRSKRTCAMIFFCRFVTK